MRRAPGAALLVLAALATPACRRASPPMNLLLVTLDTTRGDRFGCYGYAPARTPNLDAFGAQGIRFDQAVTTMPLTLGSHASILTGTYPVFHGIHDNDGYVLDDGVTSLPEVLKAKGFTTAAFVGAYPLDSQFNLDQGFETYDDDVEQDWTPAQAMARTPLSFGFAERKSDQVDAAAARWLDTHAAERFFLWVHYFDPHSPYQPPKPYDSEFAGSLYDGEVAFMDESFGKLLRMLEAKGVRERTIVLVVGDHGEGLNQHGELSHASFLYDTTMRVPLLLAVPGRWSGRTIAPQVRTIDLMPTLLELLGLPPSHDVQGKSLVPLIEDPSRPWEEDALLESHFNQFQFGWAPLRGLRTGRYKLVEAPKLELYDLVADPGELTNIAAREPALVAELRGRLSRLAYRMQAPDPGRSTGGALSPEAREKLQALGYVGGGSDAARRAPFPTPEALAGMKNPADRTLVLTIINVAQEQLRKQRYDTCLEAARNGLAMDEENYRLRMILAQCQAMLGLTDRALQELERAKALRSDDPELSALEGRIQILSGRVEKGIAALERAAKLAPQFPENLRALGTAYALAGRDREAIEHFEAALQLDERSWAAYLDLGSAYARMQRFEDARHAYQRAIELNPYSPAVLFEVGAFYARLGDAAFARRMFEGVLRIAPDNASALVALGELFLGDPALAAAGREHLQRAIQVSPGSPAAKRALSLLNGPG